MFEGRYRACCLPLKHHIGPQNILDTFQNRFSLMEHTPVAVAEYLWSPQLLDGSWPLTDAIMLRHGLKGPLSLQFARLAFHDKRQSLWKTIMNTKECCEHQRTCPPTTP
jgi:hypothetical protein